MAYSFLETTTTPSVRAARETYGSAEFWDNFSGHREFDHFTENETGFIAAQDHFYLASVSESGWPYIQHRGGPAGFLRVLDAKPLIFPDFRGNRQYISVGNAAADDRVALILVDYPHRARMKILAHMEIRKLADHPDLAASLALPGYKALPERAILLHLESFDWNCPQHITPRFTAAELETVIGPLNAKLAALEAENEGLRTQLRGGTV